MLIITILSILGIILLILGILVIASWFLTHSIIATILIPIGILILYKIIKNAISKRNLNKIYEKLGPQAPTLEQDGIKFRDLNKNGKLDIYEDPRKSVEDRVEDLLSQMSLEEKVGLMFSPMMGIGKKGELQEKKSLLNKFGTSDIIVNHNISTFAIMGVVETKNFATWCNNAQKVAEQTRLGIPLTICSDPRHEFMDSSNPLASLLDASLSKWPHPLGLAATRDEKLVEKFGDIARQELSAIGIRFA